MSKHTSPRDRVLFFIIINILFLNCVLGMPISEHDDLAMLKSAPTTKKVTIPAMAWKAGGHFLPELRADSSIKSEVIKTEAVPEPNLDESDDLALSETAPTKKVIIPAMARKAGGHFRPELRADSSIKSEVIKTEAVPEPILDESGHHGQDKPAPKVEAVEDYDDYDESDYDSSSEEELDCPDRLFYHVRGRMCVPIRCRGEDKRRNPMTGECLVDLPGFLGGKELAYYRNKQYGYANGIIGVNSHYRPSPTVWRSPPKYYKQGKSIRG